ncbi:MAG: pseudouridine-5'-phosphate glycosidase [Pseudomonadota bacterium]
MKPSLTLSAEVETARAEGRPIVALESTIISHGLPYPRNLEVAKQAEETIRNAGAAPATIAVMAGSIRIGLSDAQLSALALGDEAMKLSRADLAVALAEGRMGATTVAATMICANLAGIQVFATGGIGGVHRGAEQDFDISADLEELAKTPVTVVSAGAKAILDLPKTLEALETRGVPVIAYGADAFPAFWARDSGLSAPLRMDAAQQIAEAHKMRGALGLSGGQLIANPIPEAAEIPLSRMTPLIDAALAEADASGITGKAVTPFLLAEIFKATNGESLEANVALLLNNCRLAAEIAKALAD